MHSRSGFACAMVVFLAVTCLLPQGAWAADIIVRRDHGLTAGERAGLRAGAGVEHERMLSLPDSELVSVPDAQASAALARLNADPDVLVAAPNVDVHVAAEVSYPLEWGNDADVDANKAWQSGWEGQGVTVAVVDQEIDAGHPDLADQLEAPSRDFVSTSDCSAPVPTGVADHGTHVAGLIGARRDTVGMVGLAPLARLLPLRAIDNCGEGKIEDVLEAFHYAGRAAIPIVSASFATDVREPAAEKARVDELVSLTVDAHPHTLFVVAAGNQGANLDDPGNAVYPCSTDAPNIVCVGMTDFEDRPVCWGNVGGRSVDLLAPGANVNSTVRGSVRYLPLSGTSQATPLVAAAAALVESSDPDGFDAASLKATLTAADNLDTFSSYVELGPTGAPRLNAQGTPVRISVTGGRLNAARPFYPPDTRGIGEGARPGGSWTSCDPDHDKLRYGDDDCPAESGTPGNRGCPDADQDGRADRFDNCPKAPNLTQFDADADGLGDVCDATARGTNADGDALSLLDDRCPEAYALTADGCPVAVATVTPAPGNPQTRPIPGRTPTRGAAPEITFLTVQVTRSRTARVRVGVSRTAKVTLRIERKRGRTWTRVTTARSVTGSVRVKSHTLRPSRGKRFSRGSYRVRATVAGRSTFASLKVK